MALRTIRINTAAAAEINNGPDSLWAAELCALANKTKPVTARTTISAYKISELVKSNIVGSPLSGAGYLLKITLQVSEAALVQLRRSAISSF
jgi:hypothetical protein